MCSNGQKYGVLRRHAIGVRIRTRQGTLHADRVVIATGYATPQFRPLAGRFRMYRTYVLGDGADRQGPT